MKVIPGIADAAPALLASDDWLLLLLQVLPVEGLRPGHMVQHFRHEHIAGASAGEPEAGSVAEAGSEGCFPSAGSRQAVA